MDYIMSPPINPVFLIPLFQLTQPPVNSKVLAILSEVAGDALTKHLGKILQALMSSLKDSICTEREAQVNASSHLVKLWYVHLYTLYKAGKKCKISLEYGQ